MSSLPLRAGVAVGASLLPTFAETTPNVAFVELDLDELIGGGPALHHARVLAGRVPITLSARSLSLGSAESLMPDFLKLIKARVAELAPVHVVGELSWVRWQGTYLGEPLPFPYTDEALDQVAINIDSLQSALGRPLCVRNAAAYLEYETTHIEEGEFIDALCERTGAGLCIDLAALAASARNYGAAAEGMLETYPLDRAQWLRLSALAELPVDRVSSVYIAGNAAAPPESVVALARACLNARGGPIPLLLDWQRDVPARARLLDEVGRLQNLIDNRAKSAREVHS